MDDLDFAYVAGLIDGEGSIGFQVTSKHHRDSYSTKQLRLQIGLKDSDDVLEWLKECFGGNVYSGVRCRRWIVVGTAEDEELISRFGSSV